MTAAGPLRYSPSQRIELHVLEHVQRTAINRQLGPRVYPWCNTLGVIHGEVYTRGTSLVPPWYPQPAPPSRYQGGPVDLGGPSRALLSPDNGFKGP